MFKQIAIIGVGLLGGSFGLAAKKAGISKRALGVGRSEERLQKAVDAGAIDRYTTSVEEACAESDLVLLASHLQHSISLFPVIAEHAAEGTLVTDVGSVKGAVVSAAEKAFDHTRFFVGSHPMAGSDKTGVGHARDDLFEGAVCYVTATPNTDTGALSRIVCMWKTLGAEVMVCRPERHDFLVSLSSHMPHFAAVGIADTLRHSDSDENLLRFIVGSGFCDTTRLAKGSPDMWTDICKLNGPCIVEAIDRFIESMETLKRRIAQNDFDGIRAILNDVKSFRESLENDRHET